MDDGQAAEVMGFIQAAHERRIDLEMRAPIDPEAAAELAELKRQSKEALEQRRERRRVVRQWKEAEDRMQGE